MDVFEKVKSLEILNVLDAAGVGYKKDSWQTHTYTLLKDDGTLNDSFKVHTVKNIAKDFGWEWIEWWPFDFIGRYLLKEDTQTTTWKANTIKWFIDKWLVTVPESNKEFVKSLKGEELLDQYDSFKLWGYKAEISSLMLTRWVSSDVIQKKQLELGEIFKDIWYYDNYFCTEYPVYKDDDGKWKGEEWDSPKTVGVFLFPCYNESNKLIWIKLRRKDWKTIRGKKSLAVWKTGLIYDSIPKDTAYVVEGEMDYVILRMLWYKGVIGNEWGVQSGRKYLKGLLYETDKVVCLYDNDLAWESGKLALSETMWRPIYNVDYPVREDKTGKKLSDINDFYKVGYDTKTKWDKIFGEMKAIGEENKRKDTRFIMLDKYLEYYDTLYKRYQKTDNVASSQWMTKKELFQCVEWGSIPKYTDLCYYAWGKKGYYNTLDESVIVSHGWEEEPILHPNIEKLIMNISGNKKKNAKWIHQAILYKLTHLNDVHVPALILYGSGWSWKGTFLNLLSKIFGSENTQVWLGQKDLESSFDSYSWNKLIVEFKEVSSGNKHNDKKILDRIKSFVWEPTISVNQKNKDVKEVDNIAWFHLSSNHAVPIQLDSKHSGNRRFTIIKTGNSLWKLGTEINEKTITDPKIIQQYVAWLYHEYPEIPYMERMDALDNAEKNQLEDSCEWSANLFFEWMEAKYPHVYKITNIEKNYLLEKYCMEIGEDSFDIKYKQNNFDLWLSHRYEKKKVKVRGKSVRWYFINKDETQMYHMPEWTNWEFKEWELPWI